MHTGLGGPLTHAHRDQRDEVRTHLYFHVVSQEVRVWRKGKVLPALSLRLCFAHGFGFQGWQMEPGLG